MPKNYDDAATQQNLPKTDQTLPTAPAQENDDDGIFMKWPGAPDDGFDEVRNDSAFEGDDTAYETDASADLFSEEDVPKKKPKSKKKKKLQDEDDHTAKKYAFRRAAASDIEESFGKQKKPKQNSSENEATISSMKYYKHTQKMRALVVHRVLPIVLALVFVVGFVLYFFRLQHLSFVNLRGYDAKDVFRTCGVRKNMFIFTISDTEIADRLRTEFPYIQDVEVELTLPDTVNLVFTEDIAMFYTQLYDEYFVISESMRVLARYDSAEALDPSLRQITLPSVSYAVVGHELQFFDASYLSFLSEFLSIIEKADIYDGIVSMDLSNRFYLNIIYEDRLDIDLGDNEDIETKLLFVKAIIEALEPDDTGAVTLIDNKKATFSPVSPGSESQTITAS